MKEKSQVTKSLEKLNSNDLSEDEEDSHSTLSVMGEKWTLFCLKILKLYYLFQFFLSKSKDIPPPQKKLEADNRSTLSVIGENGHCDKFVPYSFFFYSKSHSIPPKDLFFQLGRYYFIFFAGIIHFPTEPPFCVLNPLPYKPFLSLLPSLLFSPINQG